MAAANGTKNNKLMQEIYDQFLVCRICFETYRSPKTLSCLHTFCALCLEKHQDAELERSYRYLMFSRTVKCPICRKNTDLPPGGIKRLPDNFLVANLNDIISRKRNCGGRAPHCEICQQNPAKPAVSKCLDCSKLLCSSCLDMHKKTKVTRYHSYIDADVEKDIECKVHKDEVVKFYCQPCEMCICVLCTFQEHKGHDVTSFTDGMHKYSSTLDNLVSLCRDKINTVKTQLELINRCESQLKNAEERIRDTATDSILTIRRREKEMVNHLYNTFGEEGINFLKEKQPLQETLECLQSTTNLTDVILKDKSVELLLLKREIENKLEVLLEKRMGEPPDVMLKPIPQFVPEAVHFGHLDNEFQRKLSTGQLHNLHNGCDSVVQSRSVSHHEQCTSMGISQCDFDMDTSIQTDTSFESESDFRFPDTPSTSASQFTMTLPPDVMERQTMTESPSVTKRKVQTMPISQSTKETETERVPSRSTGVSTIPPETYNEGTLTNRIENYDCVTDTDDLIRLKCTAMETESPKMRNSGTYTEPIKRINKASQNEKPEQFDKVTFTPKIQQRSRETETEPTYKLNFGQTFRTPCQNRGTGTKTTVLMHIGVGDHVAESRDQAVETIWRGSITPMSTKSTMPDLTYCTQSTETDKPKLRDSCTSPLEGTFQQETTKRELDEDTYELFLKKFRSNLVDQVTMTDELLSNGTPAEGNTAPRYKTRNKGLVTKGTKHNGTYTYVSTIEKATYMPQPVVVSTGTSTPTKNTADKKLNTPVKQYVNSSTNTPQASRPLEVPSAFKTTRKAVTCSRGTNTSTSGGYRGSASEFGIMKAMVARHDVGVLKRPHTMSRGVGSRFASRAEHSTSMEAPYTKEVGCSADLPDTSRRQMVDRQSSPIPPPIIHRATSTLSLHLVDRESSPVRFAQLCKSTSTPQLNMEPEEPGEVSPDALVEQEKKETFSDAGDLETFYDARDDSPVTVSRGTCTRSYEVVHRETSPVKFADGKPRTVDKAVMVSKADLLEPQDKFHRAGSGVRRGILDEDDVPYKPNLEAIREDSYESRSSDDEHSRSGKASPTLSYSYSTPMVEEIKSITSSIVTHTEKLWVTATQSPSGSMHSSSTFIADGKMSPTSILCTVEAGTSTPPIPEKEDKAVSTESVAVDSKMAECISKLKTVRERLEQHNKSTAGGTAIHPAPGPIYTKTQHQPVCMVTSSPERTTKVTSTPVRDSQARLFREERTRSSSEHHRPRPSTARDSPASSTDSGPDSPTGSVSRGRKARKQRVDLSQMLTSSAVMAQLERHSSSSVPGNPEFRRSPASVQPPLIPKLQMNIKDYKKHSPGVKRKSRSRLGMSKPDSLQEVSDSTAECLGSFKTEIGVTETEEQLNGNRSNQEAVDVKVSLSNKVDVNFLPTEDNIRRTEKPLVRKLPPQPPRLKEKETLKISEREPTKVHVDWHKRRFLTRQLSFDDISRSSTKGGGLGGQAPQGLTLHSVDPSQKPAPMISFNYHRSTGQLQVQVPDEPGSASQSNRPPARLIRRASIDVAGMSQTLRSIPQESPLSTVTGDQTESDKRTGTVSYGMQPLLEEPNTSNQEHAPEALTDQSKTSKPKPPPRRKSQHRRGSIA